MFDCQCELCCRSSVDKTTKGEPEPVREDYICSTCSGPIGPKSGRCRDCGRQLTDRELWKLDDKALDIIIGLKKTVETAYAAIDSLDKGKLDGLLVKLIGGRSKAHALLHPTHLALEVCNRCIREIAEIRR